MDAAHENFAEAAHRHQPCGDFIGILLFTESASEQWFNFLREHVQRRPEHLQERTGWRFDLTQERCSLIARKSQERTLILVAGRQIVTAERLEVLAIGTETQYSDGAPIEQVLRDVRETGALAVIPWGFGKWMGQRGKVLDALLRRENGLVLGDNSGRPRVLPYPSQFVAAQKLGMRILPGSDPLPFASENRRPGSYGVILESAIDLATPGRDLRRLLADHEIAITPYGAPEQTLRFVRNQVRMQVVKLRAKLRSPS